VTAYSRKAGIKSAVITFDRPPRQVEGLLTTTPEKIRILRSLGIDEIEIIEFTREFARMDPEEFFYNFLLKKFRPVKLFVGYDFRFGRDRAGGMPLLSRLCAENGIAVFKDKPLTSGKTRGKPSIISSSLVRKLLLEGKVEKAGSLLCSPYEVTGTVVRGKGIARTLGFPTANLRLPEGKMIPRGVFVVEADVEGKTFPGVANAGFRPTIEKKGRLVCEVHCLGLNKSVTGRSMTVRFMKFIRKEKKFRNKAVLIKQILRDVNLVNY
jgi:riboflavin kinase/FMN adenylyltransferase